MTDPAHAADLPVSTPSSTPQTEGSPAARPCPQTASEVLMSLNGFDEIAITQQFGATIGELRADAVTLGRALAYVHQRRNGLADRDAYQAAMMLTIDTVTNAYFTPEPDDASEEGNGSGGSA